MSSATFFPTRRPTSTFAPGLQNLEIHADKCSSAHGWSAAKNALFLQCLYSRLHNNDADIRSFAHYNGKVYLLGTGRTLLCFLDEVEAKYEEVTVVEAWMDKTDIVDTVVVSGRCGEELVPGCEGRGDALQFAWAFRWGFKKCTWSAMGREYESLLSEVD